MKSMTKKHPRWSEFLDRLEGPEGCNFRKNANGQTIWNCKGGHDKTLAKTILKNMKLNQGLIATTFAYFEANGGHCDCEILFNIA